MGPLRGRQAGRQAQGRGGCLAVSIGVNLSSADGITEEAAQ